MNTYPRALARVLSVSVCSAVLLAIAVSPVSAATSAAVKVRIETPTETLFNGAVQAVPTVAPGEDRPGSNPADWCDAESHASYNVSSATPLAALDAAAKAAGISYGTNGGNSAYGVALCRVGTYLTQSVGPAVDSWVVKVNNSGSVDWNTALKNGDEVLVYYSNYLTITSTLDLAVPAAAVAGTPVAGSVTEWDNYPEKDNPGKGAEISGGGAVATSGDDGSFNLTFPSPGKFLVSATKPGSMRASAWVTVQPAGTTLPATTPVPGTVRINRFLKCNGTYKKGSRKHRRCVRIVRAKQAAEKKH